MYKNAFLILLTLLSTLFLISNVIAEVPEADIAYVVVNSGGIDNFLLNEVTGAGYTYEIIFEENLQNVDLSEYRLVIYGDQNFVNQNDIPVGKYKSLILNSFDYYKTSTLWQWGLSRERGVKSSPTIIKKNILTELTSNLPDSFSAYTISNANVQTSYLKGNKPQNTLTFFYSSLSSDSVIAGFVPGITLLNGRLVEERMIFFGITEAQYWTPQTRILFENSLNWVLNGEDFDKDGFKSELDCNDFDSRVYPGATEIPYDGIDQDCSQGDLKDIDMDGFASNLAGGLDCDDTNNLINPINPNKSLNCINDAPIIQPVQEFTFREGTLIEITLNAQDPESNELFYSVNDSRGFISGNKFIWSSGFDDFGKYDFKIIVSDGELSSESILRIEITNINRAPTSLSIPEISWSEDAIIELNLAQYFFDLDNDFMEFGVETTSPDTNIVVSSEEEGIFKFTPELNWNGSDWIIFWAFDGKNKTLSNNVTLRVQPINDRAELIRPLENIRLAEDSNNFILNLSDYFKDIDSNLNYEIEGAGNIIFSINNNMLSIIPEKDYYGEQNIRIVASDEQSSIASNIFLLEVEERGEVPEISPLNCQTELNEDEESSCIINAQDVENDFINFSTRNQTNINCNFDGNVLIYKPITNFFGNASCFIVASDKDGESSKEIQFIIDPINDFPVISSSSPTQSQLSVLEGTSLNFTIFASDVDSSFQINWSVDGTSRDSGNIFRFSESLGSHLVLASVSDSSSSVERFWNVIVGPISDFSCSEVNGFICSENEFCPSNNLGVKDSLSCCSVQCQTKPIIPENIESCEFINNTLELKISDLNEDEAEAGSEYEPEIELTNELNEDLDFDIVAYLYDADKKKSLDRFRENEEIKKDSSRVLRLNFDIPEDVDDDNNHILFIKASSEGQCTQISREINIDRPEDLVEIVSFNIPSSAECGETIISTINVENLGSDDKEVNLEVSNSQLNIRHIERFEIENYGDDDEVSRDIEIKIPDNSRNGNYSIRALLNYDGGLFTNSYDLEVTNCKVQSIRVSQGDEEDIEEKKDESNVEKKDYSEYYYILIIDLVIIAMSIALYFFVRKREEKEDNPKSNLKRVK